MNVQTWFDEWDFSRGTTSSVSETSSAYAQMWDTLAMSPSWIREFDKEQARRTAEKVKRRKERENCQHGRRTFPIRWVEGVR